MSAVFKSVKATTIRLVAMLSVIKQSYPARLSSVELQSALEHIGYPYHIRTVQRYLNDFSAVGLVKGDGATPQGWQLTKAGKELLGVQA